MTKLEQKMITAYAKANALTTARGFEDKKVVKAWAKYDKLYTKVKASQEKVLREI